VPLILDASAYLAYALDEPGAEAVEAAMVQGAVMSVVNLAEVLTVVTRERRDPGISLVPTGVFGGERFIDPGELRIGPDVREMAIVTMGLPGAFDLENFGPADAVAAAMLWQLCQGKAQSLGDRACLSLGQRLGSPVLTADRAWGEIDREMLGVEVRVIR
jgi:PIN domain nuclease of toxin-antitoxin system